MPFRRRKRSRRSNWRRITTGTRKSLMFAAVTACAVLYWQYGPTTKPGFAEPQLVRLNFPLCSAPGFTANCVVDGDTLRIGERRIRLTGFDAPEIDGECQNESDLAIAATNTLHRWLVLGPFEWDGGAAPPRDQYGRELRSARRRDEYLADVMIEAGLAESDGWSLGGNHWC